MHDEKRLSVPVKGPVPDDAEVLHPGRRAWNVGGVGYRLLAETAEYVRASAS